MAHGTDACSWHMTHGTPDEHMTPSPHLLHTERDLDRHLSDLATAHIGSVAAPLGQYVGRNVGRIIGGAAGAACIQVQSRSCSRRRSSSQVRFSPDIQCQVLRSIAPHHHRGESLDVAAVYLTITAQNTDILSAIHASSAIQSAETMANTQEIMRNMATMLGLARTESLNREDVLRDEFQSLESPLSGAPIGADHARVRSTA